MYAHFVNMQNSTKLSMDIPFGFSSYHHHHQAFILRLAVALIHRDKYTLHFQSI